MRFFADQGLATPISDVWATIGGNYSEAFKSASTGNDGKQYFIPIYNYPWVVIYRKSLFEEKGYTVPTTWDEFNALARQDEDRRPRPDRLRRQATAGRRWARSTSSTCASTATTSTSA